MAKLPRISSDQVIKILSRSGFHIHHQHGSHMNLRHEAKTHLRVVIPVNRKELAPKTLKSIMIQAELTIADLIN